MIIFFLIFHMITWDLGKLNGFPEDTQLVIGKQGSDFSGLGVSPVFKSEGLRRENTGFQQFPLPQGKV